MYYLMETERCDSLTGCRDSSPFLLRLVGLLIPLLNVYDYPHPGQSGSISHDHQCLQSLSHPFLPQNMAHYSNITKERLYHLFACQLGSLLYWRCLKDRVFKMANEWEMNDMILQTILYNIIIILSKNNIILNLQWTVCIFVSSSILKIEQRPMFWFLKAATTTTTKQGTGCVLLISALER